MVDELRNISVVLVNPRDGRNVGAVCRAMKTMGLTRLALVGAETTVADEAPVVAVHARDVLQRAEYFTNLAEATKNTALIAGITRRRGKRRKYFATSPEQLAARVCEITAGRVALVFGNEASGLTDGELALCHLAVAIPTSTLFPSLNLSHAVQIIGYELFKRVNRSFLPRYAPVAKRRLEELVSVIIQALRRVGFFKQVGSESMFVFLKDILGRAMVSAREAERLEAMFRKITGLVTGSGIENNRGESS